MAPHRLVAAAETHSAVGVFLLRMAETPALGLILAGIGSILAALGHDPFTWALGMLVLASVFDYVSGTATARAIPAGRRGAYDSERAVRGRLYKIITVILMIACRMMEGIATYFGILNIGGVLRWFGWDAAAASPVIQQGGIISTVITLLISAGELESIYGHRVANGGSRVLVLELVFSSLRALQRLVLGRAAERMKGWAAGEEAAERLAGTLTALQITDDMAHSAVHGEPAPRRRAYDRARDDLSEPNAKKDNT